MSTVYLNGEFMPMREARISPMDRGFLFGDGIYEVIPSYGGKLVGFGPHLERMQNGLDAVGIQLQLDRDEWREIARQLIADNGGGDLGIYLHISRGADTKRHHAYPEGITPTVYAFAYEIPTGAGCRQDARRQPMPSRPRRTLRWRRCNIKSTSLLGNVMHFQQGHVQGRSETVLYNSHGELTEAAACNVYVIKNGTRCNPLAGRAETPRHNPLHAPGRSSARRAAYLWRSAW